MNELQLFNFEGKNVRTVEIGKQIYFVGKDVCDVLEHSNPSGAINRLDEDEKLIYTMFISGQNREILLINESGLYSLVLTSRKPEAKTFKKWITSEVIPSIRKTGGYNSNDAKYDKLFEMVADTNKKLVDLISNMTAINNNIAIKHEPKTEIPKYFQPSQESNIDYKKYHRIVNYGKKFMPNIDQNQVRERAKEIGMMASRLSKERNIKIVEEDNLDNRYSGKIRYYHENILNEVFGILF